MNAVRNVSIVLVTLCACGEWKNECGGDQPLDYQPGTPCDPYCSEAVWTCADEVRPGIALPNHIACGGQLYPASGLRSHYQPYPPGAVPGSPCELENARGQCRQGRWQCDQHDPGLDCIPLSPPEAEHCDDIDNDCDGEVDELPTVANQEENDERRTVICRPCTDLDGLECAARCEKEVSREGDLRDECWAWCQREESLLRCRPWWTTLCDDSDGDDVFDIECGNQPLEAHYGDCDDSRPEVSPGNPEVCDRLDNNCNGLVDTGSCDGRCGPGTLICQGRIPSAPPCSTDYGGPDYLPDHALCSTCGDPIPNGTIDPETGTCVAHRPCTEIQYEDLPAIVYPELDATWDLCPWIEGCGNGLDDDGDGVIDEDCIPVRCPEDSTAWCDSYATRIEYDLFEQWCPELNRHEGRRDLIQELLDWMEEGDLCEPIESDPVLTFILQHLDSNETCTEALFHWLYWLDTNQYAAEALCTEDGVAGLVESEGWIAEFFSDPCASTADRQHFTHLLITILTHTDRDTQILQEDIAPEQACLDGDLDFGTCPVPTSRSICVATTADGSECAEVENHRIVVETRCVASGWPRPWEGYLAPYDRCGTRISDGELCEHGCDPETVACNPCGCDGATCGPDNCGNSCGECNYDERCQWPGTPSAQCVPATLYCEYPGNGFARSLYCSEQSTFTAPISPDADTICIYRSSGTLTVREIDGVPGSSGTALHPYWSPSCWWDGFEWGDPVCWLDGRDEGFLYMYEESCHCGGCYNVEEYGLGGEIADGEVVLTVQYCGVIYAHSCHYE